MANLTRADWAAFLKLAADMRLQTHVVEYVLNDANRALLDLSEGKITGAAVLEVG